MSILEVSQHSTAIVINRQDLVNHKKKATSEDAAFLNHTKMELLCSRSSSFSSRSSSFFLCSFSFFCFFVLLDFLNFFLLSSRSSSISSRSCNSRVASRHVSSKYYSRERHGNDGGNDCGQNFFHG